MATIKLEIELSVPDISNDDECDTGNENSKVWIIENINCHVCLEKAKCIATENSDTRNNPVCICESCSEKIFNSI